MAAVARVVGNVIRNAIKLTGMEVPFCNTRSLSVPWQTVQVRNRYVNWMMLRDVKRRRLVKQHFVERLRINTIRRNTIIPQEVQEIAYKEIQAFPIDSCRTRIWNRCVLTSRPRGVVKPWQLSRIKWRLLADYNQLSGVQRAKW